MNATCFHVIESSAMSSQKARHSPVASRARATRCRQGPPYLPDFQFQGRPGIVELRFVGECALCDLSHIGLDSQVGSRKPTSTDGSNPVWPRQGVFVFLTRD